jgi:hypothetical protein
LDFEARAARAAVCSSRSAKRFMCPLLKGMACPEVTGVVLLSTSVLRGGEGGGVHSDGTRHPGEDLREGIAVERTDVLQRERDQYPHLPATRVSTTAHHEERKTHHQSIREVIQRYHRRVR